MAKWRNGEMARGLGVEKSRSREVERTFKALDKYTKNNIKFMRG